MLLFDATFSKRELVKPGETLTADTGFTGVSTLPKCQPCIWSGGEWGGQPVNSLSCTPERITAWRQKVGLNRLGVLDMENASSGMTDERMLWLMQTAGDGGYKWTTFAYYLHGDFMMYELAEMKPATALKLIRRLERQRAIWEKMAWICIEYQNDDPASYPLYREVHRQVSGVVAAVFPSKKRLAWVAPYYPRTDKPWNAAESKACLETIRNAGDDCLMWGPYGWCKTFYETALFYI